MELLELLELLVLLSKTIGKARKVFQVDGIGENSISPLYCETVKSKNIFDD